jgi:PAS domain S-box-containing protein
MADTSGNATEMADQFRQIVESAPNAMVMIDHSGTISMVNAETEAIFGYRRAELLGQPVEILLPDRLRQRHPNLRTSFFSAPSRRPMGAGRELYGRRQDGTEFPVEIGLNPIETEAGTIALAVIVDITERQRIAERLHETLALQAAIVASSNDAIISETVFGIITSWNHGAERMFGYGAEEVVGRTILDLIVPPDYRDEEQEKLSEIRIDGLVKSFDAPRRHKDGHLIDVAITKSPIRDQAGRMTGLSVVKRDISARKRQEERFRTIVESMPTSMVMVNRTGIIEMVNAQTEQVFGYRRHELTGRAVEMLLPGRFRARHPGLRDAFFLTPSPRAMGVGRDLHGRRQDGTEFPVEIGLNPIETDEGTMVLAAITDISERVKAGRQLAEHRDELERSNKELATFAYVASHDLKSPLRGVVQLTTWIEEDLREQKFETIPEYIQLLQSRIRRLVNLLDDLLAYSRAGRVEGGLAQVAVGELARDLFELQSPPPGLALELPGDLPCFTTLVTPFEQVLRNLFSNAIKHHDRPTGRIALSCTAAGDRFYEFNVTDDGPGIPPQYHERVFGMFQTLQPRDEVEGSGMGLALVKKVVETYGGEASIVSDGSRGCSVRFTWPRNIDRKSSPEIAANP